MKNVWEQKSEEGKGSKASAGRNFWYSVGGALMGAASAVVVQIVVVNVRSYAISAWRQLVPAVFFAVFGVAMIVAMDDRVPSWLPFLIAPLVAVVI
ncbi:MAG: hypothetical protein F4Y63_09845 [Chloroflexi bacterium]|nr:hypothetical protein [Chloroflexota bacterium]MYF78412.1 hypothetical protein [Chloroflexota bacterium]